MTLRLLLEELVEATCNRERCVSMAQIAAPYDTILAAQMYEQAKGWQDKMTDTSTRIVLEYTP